MRLFQALQSRRSVRRAEDASAPPPPPPRFSVNVPLFADESFKCDFFERNNRKCT